MRFLCQKSWKMSDPVLDPERLLLIRNQPDPSRQHRGKCFQTCKIYYFVYRVECIFSSQIVKNCNCMTQTLQLNIVWQRQTAGDVLTGFLFQKLPSIEIEFLQGLWKYNNPRTNITAMKKSLKVEILMNKMFFGRDPEPDKAGPKSSIRPDADLQHWINTGVVGSWLGTVPCVIYRYATITYWYTNTLLKKGRYRVTGKKNSIIFLPVESSRIITWARTRTRLPLKTRKQYYHTNYS